MATAKKIVPAKKTVAAAKKTEQPSRAVKSAVAKAAKAPPETVVKDTAAAKATAERSERIAENKAQAAAPATELPAIYMDGTHSALVLEINPKAVTMITMASLKIEEMRRVEFDASYTRKDDYPVKRCAEVYLSSAEYRQIDPATRERLEAICGDKSKQYKPFVSQVSIPKEPIMPKSAPTNLLRRASDAPARAAAAEKAPAAKKAAAAPAKKATTKPVEKPADVKEAKATPAKKAASEKPAAKKAPWDKGEAKAPAAEKKAPAGRTSKMGPDTKAKIGDATKAKRGAMLTYMEKAQELAKKGKGVVTKGALEAALADGWTGNTPIEAYFPYAVKNGMLVLA